jgi:hypothetical protein
LGRPETAELVFDRLLGDVTGAAAAKANHSPVKTTVQVDTGAESVPFQVDFATKRWTCEQKFGEGDFPFVTVHDGKRYEIFSDGKFSEEEL